MNKPTKIQRTVEFDEVLEEAELIIHTEAMVGLQSIIKAIEDYSNIGRKDHEFLLLMIDDIRKRMYGIDMHLDDAATMINAHRSYLSDSREQVKSGTSVDALQSAVAGLKSSMATTASTVAPESPEQEDPKG